jgi:glycosyltransferase 2 family protein
VRLLVTAGLLWALLARVDLSQAKAVFDHLSVPLLAAGAAALLATSPFSALRWHVVLGAETTSPGPWTLLKIVLVGLFFNQTLPSGVGGDAVRAWRCHRLGVGAGAAIRSILLDRVSGYFVLVALFVAGLPLLLHILPDARQRYGVVALLGTALCGLFALFLIDYLPRRLLHFRLVAEFAALSREGRRLFARPARLGTIMGLAAATVGLTILGFMLVAKSLGVDLSFVSWAVIVPPVTLIQLVPVSLAGWGVRELGFVVVLAGFGIPAEAALAASLLVGLCMIAVGLPGGLLWLTGWDIAPAIPAQSGRVASAVLKSTARAISRTTSWTSPREANNAEVQAEKTRPPPRPLEPSR